MNRNALTYRMLLLIGGTTMALLIMVAWGLQQTLTPQERQRVEPHRGASPFDGTRAYADLEKLVAIGPRVAGTENSRKAKAMIVSALKDVGLDVREYPFTADTPLGPRQMVNIVGVVEGTTDGLIVLGNHYDTKYLPDIRFVGANDGGSTTAWMMEMARTLGRRRQGHEIWLCFFDGEEAFEDWSDDDSLYGSRWMADWMQSEGLVDRVTAMINVDMIGDCYLGIFKDPGAPAWLTESVWGRAEELGYERHFLSLAQRIDDDHLPFRQAGMPAINLIDFRYGGSSLDHRQNWHTANDTLDRVCPESLQAVGDVIYHVILDLDRR